MAMKGLTAAEVAAKYRANGSAAAGQYKAGILRVTEAPGKKAAAQVKKMRAKILEALDSGKWAKNVGAVSLTAWQEKASTKGADRFGPGIIAAEVEFEGFMSQFLPHLEAGVKKIEQMPNMNLEDSIARSAAMIRHNASFKRS